MSVSFVAVELACDGPCRFKVPEDAHFEYITAFSPEKDANVPCALQRCIVLLQDSTYPGELWHSFRVTHLRDVSWNPEHNDFKDLELRAIVRDACGFWWGVFERSGGAE